MLKLFSTFSNCWTCLHPIKNGHCHSYRQLCIKNEWDHDALLLTPQSLWFEFSLSSASISVANRSNQTAWLIKFICTKTCSVTVALVSPESACDPQLFQDSLGIWRRQTAEWSSLISLSTPTTPQKQQRAADKYGNALSVSCPPICFSFLMSSLTYVTMCLSTYSLQTTRSSSS